jgi:hypothetical protein
MEYKLFCLTCKKEVVPKESFKKKVDGNYMVRGECPVCGKWLKWLPYADSVLVKDAIKFYAELPENEGLTHD